MNIHLNLFILLGLVFAAWILWNLLEVVYRVVVLAVYAIIFALLTAWEWTWFITRWAVVVRFKRIARR